MAGYTYNTRISLIKAGRIVNNRIITSLVFIWLALIIGSVVLFMNSANFVMQPNNSYLQGLSLSQPGEQSSDGAFVFVVRNKQMTLTKYKGFIKKGKERINSNANKPIATSSTQKTSARAIVLKQKNIPKKQPDFSIKKVPVQ